MGFFTQRPSQKPDARDQNQDQSQGDNMEHGVRKRDVAKYALLPGILPRLKRLSGVFAHFLHVFTLAFAMGGLIDQNHPCLRSENVGKYKFSDVVGLAFRKIKWQKDHIPQILMFFGVLSALLITLATGVLGLLTLIASPSNAYAQDFANGFLRAVFGDTGLGFWEDDEVLFQFLGFTELLKGMLRAYSMAILFIAVLMVLYIIVNNVVIAARTGQPFTDRFNPVWAPIRLALAFALLVPMFAGVYNGAQGIVFWVADKGSSLATSIWDAGMNHSIEQTHDYLGRVQPLYSPYRIMHGIYMMEVCHEAWRQITTSLGLSGIDIEAAHVRNNTEARWFNLFDDGDIDDMLQQRREDAFDLDLSSLSTGSTRDTSSTLGDFADDYHGIMSSVPHEKVYYPVGVVKNFCGSYSMPRAAGSDEAAWGAVQQRQGEFPLAEHVAQGFEMAIDQGYTQAIRNAVAPKMVTAYMNYGEMDDDLLQQYGAVADALDAPTAVLSNVVNDYVNRIHTLAYGIVGGETFQSGEFSQIISGLRAKMEAQRNDSNKKGWASAGMFYFRFAETYNGVTDVMNMYPQVISLPRPLYNPNAIAQIGQCMRVNKFGQLENPGECEYMERAGLLLHNILDRANEAFINGVLFENESFAASNGLLWQAELGSLSKNNSEGAERAVDQLKNIMLPLGDLLSINPLHDPLSELVRLGQMSEHIILASLTASAALGVAGEVPLIGGAATAAIGLLQTVILIMIAVWIALMIIIPAFPFIYFTFAVLEWVLGVIEAVVGMPLWCLALISGEGDDLLSQNAIQGGWALFDLYLRPTIIVMALLVTVMIFKGAMFIMNVGFSEFINDVQGWFLAKFFYFAVYAAFVYVIAQSVFKLIDVIPEQFMRWTGRNGNSFSKKFDASGFERNAYAAFKIADSAANQMVGAASGVGSFVGKTGGAGLMALAGGGAVGAASAGSNDDSNDGTSGNSNQIPPTGGGGGSNNPSGGSGGVSNNPAHVGAMHKKAYDSQYGTTSGGIVASKQDVAAHEKQKENMASADTGKKEKNKTQSQDPSQTKPQNEQAKNAGGSIIAPNTYDSRAAQNDGMTPRQRAAVDHYNKLKNDPKTDKNILKDHEKRLKDQATTRQKNKQKLKDTAFNKRVKKRIEKESRASSGSIFKRARDWLNSPKE